jgi:hypothetical protein
MAFSDSTGNQKTSPPGSASSQALSQSKPWLKFQKKAGRWLAHWNKATRTPHIAVGTPLPLVSYPLTPDNIETACTDFILAYQDLLGTNSGQFHKIQAAKAGGRWYVAFEQTHNGVPVLGGKIRMAFTKDDRLIAFGSDIYPDVNADTTPTVAKNVALKIALADCLDKADRISDAKLFIVPVQRGSAFDYTLCWRFEILQSKIQKKWRYLIDAHSGKIISKVDTLWYANIFGNVRGEYKPEYATDPTLIEAFPYEKVLAEGPEKIIQAWDFSTDPGWQTEGAWAFGTPLGGGSECGDPCSGYTGSNVYGYNLAGNYSNNMSERYLTTTPIDCSKYSTLRLKFKRWLGVENSLFDHASVEVSNNGVNWVKVWDHNGPSICDGQWVSAVYDISSVAALQPSVFIRWAMGPTDNTVTFPGWNIDDVEVVAVQGGIDNAATNDNGDYRVKSPWNPSSVKSELSGSYVDINYADGPGASFMSLPLWHGTVNWTWDKNLYNVLDESNVYRHINYIHDYYKILDRDFSGLDYPVPVEVYVDFSNAYWDGEGLAFGRGDGIDFGDFALYAEVIYHEYTHGVTDKIYTGFDLPYYAEAGAMNEGWSDYFGAALSLSQSPLIGEGGIVINEPNGFRSLSNTYRRETDWVNEVHLDSQMFDGSLWEARQAAGADVMDELVHFALYGHAADFEDYLMALLIEDDTRYGDNDLSNGTPHAQAIFTGFGNHGIGGLQYLAPSIVIANDTKNHDARLDPDEAAAVSVTLTNGWADASNIHAVLSTSDSFVSIIKGGASFPNAVFGGARNNASDPFTVFVSPACPETHTLRFTLTITASGPYQYSRTCLLYYNVAVHQLTYDDGAPDDIVNYGAAGGGLAVKITPDVYPAYPTHVRLFPAYSTGITVKIWGQDPNGAPGAELASVSVHPPASNDWFDVDVSQLGLVINSGSVYVGWVEGQGLYANGFDYDPPYYQRSWISIDPNWYPLEDFGYLGNFMVRMRYATQPPLRINSPDEYTWCPGRPVSVCLNALNGSAPYHDWKALPLPENYSPTVLGSSLFVPAGLPQNIHEDDAIFDYNLPFAFPYYGSTYNRVHICTNGFIDFVNTVPFYSNNVLQLMDNIWIAPLWDDFVTFEPNDIYIDESVAGQVTIRWQAGTFFALSPANFDVVLFGDGRIRFDYGSGNSALSPTVGISAGDGIRYILVSGYNATSNLTDARSVLFTPVPPQPSLPPGVILDPLTGCFSGAPSAEGSYAAAISVTDSSPQPQTAIRQTLFNVGYLNTDLNADCSVDFMDYAAFGSQWIKVSCNSSNGWCSGGDFNRDARVNFRDLLIFTQDWLGE